MGLFKKRNRGMNLDLPPPPPPSDSHEMPNLPSKEEEMPPPPIESHEIPPLPVENNLSKRELHSTSFLNSVKEALHLKKNKQPKIESHELPMPDIKELEKDIPPVPNLDDLEGDLPPLRELDNKEISEMKVPEIESVKEHERIDAGPIDYENLPGDKIEELNDNNNPEILQEEKEIEGILQENQNDDERIIKEGPVFVNVNSYKDAINNISLIRKKVNESENYLKRLNEMKDLRDKYFEQFRSKLEDLQRKSHYVDKRLFEGDIK